MDQRMQGNKIESNDDFSFSGSMEFSKNSVKEEEQLVNDS